MHPEDRLEIFIAAAFGVAALIAVFNLPAFLMDIVIELGTSFVISGFFYAMLAGVGLDFLEDIELIGFISLMTIAVFLTKNIIMPS